MTGKFWIITDFVIFPLFVRELILRSRLGRGLHIPPQRTKENRTTTTTFHCVYTRNSMQRLTACCLEKTKTRKWNLFNPYHTHGGENDVIAFLHRYGRNIYNVRMWPAGRITTTTLGLNICDRLSHSIYIFSVCLIIKTRRHFPDSFEINWKKNNSYLILELIVCGDVIYIETLL